jgi:hypothetical protein
MPRGENTAHDPRRRPQDLREVFDYSIADVNGVATRRRYVSRYDEAGNYVSQGYTHHGPATENERRRGTWKGQS